MYRSAVRGANAAAASAGSRLRRDAEARRFAAYAARFGLAGDAAAHAPRVPAC